MSNTDYENLAEENERYREYLRGQFGDDIFTGLATDPIPTGPTRSAQQINKDQRDGLRAGRMAVVDDNLETAAALDADRRAYDQFLDEREAGRPSSAQTKIAADRHARRHGLIPRKSSAQRLIDQAQRQRRRG